MKYILLIALLIVGISSTAQEPYQYRKGEIKVVVKLTNVAGYNKLSIKGNRIKIAHKWVYFQGDSVVLYRSPCASLVLTVVHGSAVGAKKGAACPIDVEYNYNNTESCGLLLNRSASREL